MKRQADQNTLLLTAKKLEQHEKDMKRHEIKIAIGITCMKRYTTKSSRELETCVKEIENDYERKQLGYKE